MDLSFPWLIFIYPPEMIPLIYIDKYIEEYNMMK